MGDQAGRLDVLSRQTPRVPAGAAAADLSFDAVMHRAKVLANSGMVPKTYADKPEAIVFATIYGAELGWSMVTSLRFIDPIEGRAEVNAQGRLALIREAGHEAEVVDSESDDKRATVRGRRHESKDWHVVTWTIEEADRAGLTAEWVKRWVDGSNGRKGYFERVYLRREGPGYVPAKFGQTELPDWALKAIAQGKVEHKDNWWNYPSDQLVARAASRLCRRHFSDVMIGHGVSLYTAEEQGHQVTSDLDETAAEGIIVSDGMSGMQDGQDDEITDAEIVEQGEDPGLTPPPRSTVTVPVDPPLNPPELAGEQPEVYANRRRRANAVMGEVGVKTDDARHQLVHTSTGGATQSTGRLTAWQVEAIVAFCDRLKESKGGEQDGETRHASPKQPPFDHPATADRDNAGEGPVVGSPAAPGPDWREIARARRLPPGALLRQARDFADTRGLRLPASIDDVPGELDQDLAAWLQSLPA